MIVVDNRRFRRGVATRYDALRFFGARDCLRQTVARAGYDTARRGSESSCTWLINQANWPIALRTRAAALQAGTVDD